MSYNDSSSHSHSRTTTVTAFLDAVWMHTGFQRAVLQGAYSTLQEAAEDVKKVHRIYYENKQQQQEIYENQQQQQEIYENQQQQQQEQEIIHNHPAEETMALESPAMNVISPVINDNNNNNNMNKRRAVSCYKCGGPHYVKDRFGNITCPVLLSSLKQQQKEKDKYAKSTGIYEDDNVTSSDEDEDGTKNA